MRAKTASLGLETLLDRALIVAAILCASLWADSVFADGNSDNQQLECDVANGGVLVTTGNLKHTNPDGTASNRRLFDIDADGISFHVKPIVYAKQYQQIDHIEYTALADKPRGLVSIIVKDEGGYVEVVGILDSACWFAIEHFVNSNKVALSLRETAAK